MQLIQLYGWNQWATKMRDSYEMCIYSVQVLYHSGLPRENPQFTRCFMAKYVELKNFPHSSAVIWMNFRLERYLFVCPKKSVAERMGSEMPCLYETPYTSTLYAYTFEFTCKQSIIRHEMSIEWKRKSYYKICKQTVIVLLQLFRYCDGFVQHVRIGCNAAHSHVYRSECEFTWKHWIATQYINFNVSFSFR